MLQNCCWRHTAMVSTPSAWPIAAGRPSCVSFFYKRFRKGEFERWTAVDTIIISINKRSSTHISISSCRGHALICCKDTPYTWSCLPTYLLYLHLICSGFIPTCLLYSHHFLLLTQRNGILLLPMVFIPILILSNIIGAELRIVLAITLCSLAHLFKSSLWFTPDLTPPALIPIAPVLTQALSTRVYTCRCSEIDT